MPDFFVEGIICCITLILILFVLGFVYVWRRMSLNKIKCCSGNQEMREITVCEIMNYGHPSPIIPNESINLPGMNEEDLQMFLISFIKPYQDAVYFIYTKIMPAYCDNLRDKLKFFLELNRNGKENDFRDFYKIRKDVDFKKTFIMAMISDKVVETIVRENNKGLLVCYGLALFSGNYKNNESECQNELHVAFKNIITQKLLEHINELNDRLPLVIKRFHKILGEILLNHVKEYIIRDCEMWFEKELKCVDLYKEGEGRKLITLVAQEFVNIIFSQVIMPERDIFTTELTAFKFIV